VPLNRLLTWLVGLEEGAATGNLGSLRLEGIAGRSFRLGGIAGRSFRTEDEGLPD